MAQNQHAQVHRLTITISDQMSVAPLLCCVTCYAKNSVGLVFGAGGVLDGDEARSGIVVDKHLVSSRPAQRICRSSRTVSLQVKDCSPVTAFHSRQFAITVSASFFQTLGPSARA